MTFDDAYVTVGGSHGRCFEIRPPESYTVSRGGRRQPQARRTPRRLFSNLAGLRPQPQHVDPSVGGVGDGPRALRRAPGSAGRPGGQHGIALQDRAGDCAGHRIPHHGDLPALEKHAGVKEGGRLACDAWRNRDASARERGSGIVVARSP